MKERYPFEGSNNRSEVVDAVFGALRPSYGRLMPTKLLETTKILVLRSTKLTLPFNCHIAPASPMGRIYLEAEEGPP